jgi:hypothetical protein
VRSFRSILKAKAIWLSLSFTLLTAVVASAQPGQPAPAQPQKRPTITFPTERATPPTAREAEYRCGGYITLKPTQPAIEIVGAEAEEQQRIFAEGDFVFIGGGAREAMKVGETFWIVRPRGQFRSTFSHKKGSLGVYHQEVGRVRIVRVNQYNSIAQIINSCDNILLGDLLRQTLHTDAPPSRAEEAFDHFPEPTGKQTGRIVLARDGRETLSRDQVVFIDLGTEDNVKPGDFLTVFRPNQKGIIVGYGDEIVRSARDGYQSDEFRGGKFSNQAQRNLVVEHNAKSETVRTPKIIDRRPPMPRKVVGEIVVMHVEGRTASAVITRATQEIHTGDYVELQ